MILVIMIIVMIIIIKKVIVIIMIMVTSFFGETLYASFTASGQVWTPSTIIPNLFQGAFKYVSSVSKYFQMFKWHVAEMITILRMMMVMLTMMMKPIMKMMTKAYPLSKEARASLAPDDEKAPLR